jgi:hypothetical protein
MARRMSAVQASTSRWAVSITMCSRWLPTQPGADDRLLDDLGRQRLVHPAER